MSHSNDTAKTYSNSAEPLQLTDGREDRRVQTDLPVILNISGVNFQAEFKDLSDSGAAVSVRTGLVPRASQELTLTLVDGSEKPATVVWQDGSHVGLMFNGSKVDAADVLDPAHLGEDYFKGLIRMRRMACS
ncbi:MAG: PilZ domain-containing protein [Filomicrobium sp.]